MGIVVPIHVLQVSSLTPIGGVHEEIFVRLLEEMGGGALRASTSTA
jgi:hypothetical protein